MSYKVINCLGDSIANGYWDERGHGWFGRLCEKLATKHPKSFGFNNLAQDGDRIIDVWHRLCSEVISRHPDILLIAVGVNDTIRWHSREAPMDISIQARKEYWFNILDKATKTIDTVIVCGLLPVLEEKFPQPGAYDQLLYHRNADIDEYNDLLREWAAEHSVPYIPLADAWEGYAQEDLVADSSHPNGKGHDLIAEFMYNEFKRLRILD